MTHNNSNDNLFRAPSRVRLTRHVQEQAALKGIDIRDVLLAAEDPHIRYESGGRHRGQFRHIRDGIVAVVSADGAVITCYVNVVETPLRADQR